MSACTLRRILLSAGTLLAHSRGAMLGREAIRAVEHYKPLRQTPRLFEGTWPSEWFDARYLSMHDELKRGNTSAFFALAREEGPDVYSFPLFTPLFCELLMLEVDNYKASGLPFRRPNSMNNYGLIFNEIGMRESLTELQQTHLLPISQLLFPKVSSQFDDHHSFMVQYKGGEDLGLDMHTDDSDVTFNICLGRDFTGAGLTFCGMRGDPDHRHFQFVYQHEVGRVVVHSGDKRHGADDIETGQRNNLIIWNQNFAWRSSKENLALRQQYAKEASSPDIQCLSYTHDRDYALFKTPPPGQNLRGWCPPPGREYPGFGEKPKASPQPISQDEL